MRKVAGAKWKPTPGQPAGLVFTTATGGVTDPRGPNRMLAILCRDAKVRRVRVHDLRHTCASLLLAQGVDARTIMETLGHSTITMTLDTYAHVMDTTLRAAAERMDSALGERRTVGRSDRGDGLNGDDDQADNPEQAGEDPQDVGREPRVDATAWGSRGHQVIEPQRDVPVVQCDHYPAHTHDELPHEPKPVIHRSPLKTTTGV
ncbi:tyrosine-type recombinase/integrase [Streptomyces sp. NPDC087843]|uniref:tyrosine-type recombinase/integrase n=1 Tax=Streptomyces sp. NPDC087843 TaxID=3365804 RepID=UPI00381EA004